MQNSVQLNLPTGTGTELGKKFSRVNPGTNIYDPPSDQKLVGLKLCLVLVCNLKLPTNFRIWERKKNHSPPLKLVGLKRFSHSKWSQVSFPGTNKCLQRKFETCPGGWVVGWVGGWSDSDNMANHS